MRLINKAAINPNLKLCLILIFLLGVIVVGATNSSISFDLIPSAYAQDNNSANLPSPDPNKNTNGSVGWVPLILIIVLGGAFGGFVDGLRRDSSYEITFKNHRLQIGTVGDALVGAAAAIVIFTVADSIFDITLELQSNAPKEFIKLIAWTVLSGYVGQGLLSPLSEKLVRQLAASAAREEVSKKIGAADDAQFHVKEGDLKRSEYDSLGALTTDSLPRMEDLLEEAKVAYDLALQLNPQDKPSHLGKSLILRRKADCAEFTGNSSKRENLIEQAMGVLNQVISFAPDFAKAHYNLACYKAISGKTKDEVKVSLERAISLHEGLKVYAKKDKDFDSLKNKNKKWFENIVK